MIDYLFPFIAFLMVAYYIGSPVLLYVSLKIAAEPTLQPAQRADFPSEMAHDFIEIMKRFAADGFESEHEYLLSSADPDTLTALATLTHPKTAAPLKIEAPSKIVERPKTGDRIVLMALLLRFGDEWRPVMQWIEITTRFQDGSRICTSNCPEPEWFTAPTKKRLFHFPAEKDERQLYKLHDQAVACFAPESPPVKIPPGADAAATFLEDFKEDCAYQQSAGILCRDSRESAVYHPTLFGAFRLTWRRLFPFREARQWRDHARAAALLAELTPNRDKQC